MFVYYAAFALLAAEAILLVLLLVPIAGANKIGALIVNSIRQPLYVTLALMLFFTGDQTMDMRKHQLHYEEVSINAPRDTILDAKVVKFRSERNFYLAVATTSLLIILIRMASVVGQLQESQARVRTLVQQQGKKNE